MRARTAAIDVCTLYRDTPPDPATILGAGLVLDLNGDVGVTTVGGKVSAWVDQSPKGNSPSQPTAARRMTPSTTLLNGHVGLSGVLANNQYLVLATGFTGIAVGDKPHAYVVADVTPTTCALFELSDSAANNRAFNLALTGNSVSVTCVLGASVVRFSTLAAMSTGARRYEGFTNTADQAETRGGDARVVSAATAGGLAVAPTRLTVGVLADAASWGITGTIYRLLIANPAPTALQHGLITSYLRATYGV